MWCACSQSQSKPLHHVIGLTPIVHVAKLDCEGCEAIRHRNDGAAPESRHREEHVFYRSATMIERTELGLLTKEK